MTVKRNNTDISTLGLLNTDTNAYAAGALNQYTGATGGPAVSPLHDEDGNLTLVRTSTGVWNVTCDAENRPVCFSGENGTTEEITGKTEVSGWKCP